MHLLRYIIIATILRGYVSLASVVADPLEGW